MSTPITSAQIQATASQVLPNQNTPYYNKPSKNIKILTVINQTTPKNNQSSVLFNNSITDQQVSVVNGKAIIKHREKTSHSGMQLSTKPLGTGCFGHVFKGFLQNEHDQKVVAIKNLKFGLNVTRDFYSETNALHILKNEDHVVTMFFALYDTSGVNNYIIMECGDMNLDRYLSFITAHSDIGINNKQLAKIGYDTFSGILACLKYSVLNIDIKLDNYIMFFDQNIIKLADFGVLSPNKQDGSVQIRMIRKAAHCFVKCALSSVTTSNTTTQKQQLGIISSRCNAGANISNENKTYFNEEMLHFVDNNPLLLKLAQGVFSGESNISDITKTIEDIKESGMQTPTDIRHMLKV